MTVKAEAPITPAVPAVAAAPAALRPAMMVQLVAGRGTFRIGTQLMAVALAAAWGTQDYGRFANAVGLCLWLVFVPTAAEKAALKLVPRTRLLRPAVAGLCLRIAAAPVVALHAALVLALLAAPASTATVYLAAACWSSGTGLLMTVSGLHRLRGRPGLDAVAFGCAAVVVAVTTGLTLLTGWSPRNHLLVLVAGVAVLVTGAVLALPKAWLRGDGPPRRRRLLPAVGRSTCLLGVSELFDAAALSVVFLVLAASGRTADSGPFYLALLAASAVGTFVLYQLKLMQPVASARLRGTGGTGGRARALALLGSAERAGLAFATVLAVALLVPATRSLLRTDPYAALTVLVGLVAVELTLSLVVMYASFLLENTNNRVLTITSAAAAIGLAATALLAVALAPPFGAVGGFAAIILATAVKATALRRMLLRHHPELRT